MAATPKPRRDEQGRAAEARTPPGAEGPARAEGPSEAGAPAARAAPEDARPELLIKLQERKKRHAERGMFARVMVVIAGVLLVIAGIVLSGPGIPGPGFLLILLGLSFLALEFDRAERLLERAIVWADNAKARAENAPAWQKRLTAVVSVLALAAFVAAAILYDIPLLPV